MIKNLWYEFYSINKHLLTKSAILFGENYLKFEYTTNSFYDYKNQFYLDGSSDYTLNLIITEFLNKKNELVIPSGINKNSNTIFFLYAEGYCSDNFFNFIHHIIDLCQIQGTIALSNAAYNNKQCYDDYCNKYKLSKKITKFFYKNSLIDYRNEVYSVDTEYTEDKKDLTWPITYNNNLKLKKLYTCLNWNPWIHRFAIIAMLNYYNLIDDGIITSPGTNKFSYDPEKDFKYLIKNSETFFKNHKDVDLIINKLYLLQDRYPLKVDDRTQYSVTDDSLLNKKFKILIDKARSDSIIEIVTETLFDKEHFFSEKTFLPLMMRKPIIFVSSQGILKTFRELGFKSFSPLIDESYDDEPDPINRIEMICKEIQRLKNLRETEPKLFYDLHTKIRPNLNFNKLIFYSKKFRLI